MKLSAYYGEKLYERESLIIFDEVQLYPRARSAIKYLVADGRYDFIETGSLISIKKNVKDILIPSEEDSINMYPMDFEEFLWAVGNEAMFDLIRDCYNRKKPLGQALHRKAMDYFRQYMIVGGMPQAVKAYVDTNDFDEVESTKYGYCLSLKSEYADKVVDADVAFEYYFSEPCYVDIEYNIDTKHIIVGEVYTEDLIKDKNMSDIGMYATEEHYGTNSFNSSNIENGRRYKVMEYEYRGKALEVANNIATWCSAFYQNADITRIQGTLTIIE